MSGYKTFGVDEISFDEGMARGWSTVTGNEWTFSTSSLDRLFSSPSVVDADDGQHVVHSGRFSFSGPTVKHPLDGTKYATREDATRAGYEAGILQFFVRDARVGV